jgi:hypothetical protein
MNETEPNLKAKAAEVKSEAKAAEPKTEYRDKIIFTLSILGVLAALVAACLFGVERKAQPPVFKPVSNPYDSAIFANGIIESGQASGDNINIFPEVPGPIITILNLGLAFGMVVLIAGISSYVGVRKVLKIEPFDIFSG